jgi:COP9 signalosome complex subunit 12
MMQKLIGRAPLESSRKWGTYFFASMLIKTYFRLNKPSLSSNVQKAVSVTDLPSLAEFPRSHVVTWKYYCGVFAFGKEDYETVLQLLQRRLMKGST